MYPINVFDMSPATPILWYTPNSSLARTALLALSYTYGVNGVINQRY